MKKFFSFLFALAIVFTSCKKDEDPVKIEILKDTDMESPSGSTWIINGIEGKLAKDYVYDTRSTEESFSPTHSLKISKPTMDVDSFAYAAQGVTGDLPINKNLTLSAMIKCKNLIGNGVSIVIRCDDDNKQLQFVTTQNNQLINGTFDWKEFHITLDKVNSATTWIIVFLCYLGNTTGTVYFDDVHLTYEK